VFALALVVLALALMALGGDVPGLGDRATYRIVFPHAEGLLPGAPVRMAGVDIGSVATIRLPRAPEGAGIEVHVAIEQAYVSRIREDSRAGLRILQLLTNEKYVEISPGSPDLPALPEGAQLPTTPAGELLEQGEAIAENLVEITAALRAILEPLQRGEGIVGRVLLDPEFGKESVEALGASLQNLHHITDDLRAGRGVAGRLLYDEELAQQLDRLGGVVERLGELIATVERREGLLGELLVEGGQAELALADLAAAAASARRIAARLETEGTLLGDLINAPPCPTSPSRNACEILDNLARISARLESGEGTLGALINERELYDGFDDLVGGANDSQTVRWLLRRLRKQQLESELEQIPPPAPPPGAEGGKESR
jgi:phospholipid/cholesterol/gamma-HCH transport system substrate-binding protein